MGIDDVLKLLGGVALFLFGMSLMGDSLKKVAGNKLELILYRLSSTPVKGILLGTGVTAAIQSSSATSVMVVGFVNSDMMKPRQAIGVIMGAIIGTSITGWIICLSSLGENAGGLLSLFSTEILAALVAIIGAVLHMFAKKSSRRQVGDVLLGFAILMYGMQAMSGSVSGLRTNESFVGFITSFSNPLLGVLAGILFTSVLQSASAAVGIVQALSVTGAIRFDAALPLIMGIAIGAAVPVLLSALGSGTDGKRTALSYLTVDVLGVIIVSAVFYALNAALDFSFMGRIMNSVNIAFVNTLFRVIVVIVLAPFISVIEKIGRALVKEGEQEAESHDMDRLEERFLAHPALAVEQSRLAINSMAEITRKNLFAAFGLLKDYSDAGYDKVEKTEGIIDRYEDKLGTYLMSATAKEMTKEQNSNVGKYLHSITDIERIGDHAFNVAEAAREISEKKITFSEEGERELNVLIAAVSEVMRISFEAFTENNLELAYRVEPLEELVDDLCDEMKLHHIDRLRNGECTFERGFVFNDLLTDLERVSDHCSNIALAMIESESDSFDAHEYISSLNDMHTKSFDAYYDEYCERFKI